MEPYMSYKDWRAKSKKLPGNAGKFYMLCQYVDGKMGGLKEVTPAVRRGRAVQHRPGGSSVAAVLERDTHASHLGAGGQAEIAEAKADGDASMAREAGNWARSIDFTEPRAPYAPSGAAAAGFPEPVELPADRDELGRMMAGRLNGLLVASRDRVRAPGQPAP